MAKYIHIYPLFGLLLLGASCSQEEVNRGSNQHQSGRIEFRASLPEISTRASEITDASLDHFQVSSLIKGATSLTPHFLDKTFSYNTESESYFSTDPSCIWPNNNDVVTFVAFSPSCDDMRTNGGFQSTDFLLPSAEEISTDYRLSRFKVANDIAAQVDFITAIGSGNLLDNEETPIDLNFQHQLSRIHIKAWGNSVNYNLEIAGVRLGGVGTEGVFNFSTEVADAEQGTPASAPLAGSWEEIGKGSVEYVFRNGDELVILNGSDNSPLSADKAVSILGNKIGGAAGYENSAMVLPSAYSAWNYKGNAENGENHNEGLYLSVLMRVTDTTPYAPGSIVYPYGVNEAGVADNSDGMEVIYLAVDKADGKTVKTRLYAKETNYYTDEACMEQYTPDGSIEVKAFGWAALPVDVDWKPGYVYTYTLNYTNGVGLHNPTDAKPGEPIISDKVLINVTMTEWKGGGNSDVLVPRR